MYVSGLNGQNNAYQKIVGIFVNATVYPHPEHHFEKKSKVIYFKLGKLKSIS
jgi:hypothetical protein